MELRIPPVLLMFLVAAAMWMVARLIPAATYHASGSLWLSGLFFLLGTFTAMCGVYAFRMKDTTVDPRSPEKTSALVTKGIYKFSRNPMYLGFLLWLLAWSIFLANILTVILLPVFMLYMHRFQIEPEEQQMMKLFNGEYLLYKKRVRRWI